MTFLTGKKYSHIKIANVLQATFLSQYKNMSVLVIIAVKAFLASAAVAWKFPSFGHVAKTTAARHYSRIYLHHGSVLGNVTQFTHPNGDKYMSRCHL